MNKRGPARVSRGIVKGSLLAALFLASLAAAQPQLTIETVMKKATRAARPGRYEALIAPGTLGFELPGRLTVVLLESAKGEWGTPLGEAGALVWDSPGKVYRMIPPGGLPRAVFFATAAPCEPAPAKSAHAPLGVRELSSAAANPFGLMSAVHLAEVEVNAGFGTKDERAVLTSVRRLDGTKELPLDAAAQLKELTAAYKKVQAKNAAKWTPVQESLARELEKEGFRSHPTSAFSWPTPVVHVTWLEAERRLRVAFLERWSSHWKQGFDPVPVHCTDGRPCAQPRGAIIEVEAGVDMGALFEVDANGKRVRSELTEPRSYRLEPRPH